MQTDRYYSEEFNEIIKKKLPDVLKWGWVIVGGLFILMVLSSYFIRYPLTVSYQIHLKRDSMCQEYSGIFQLSSRDINPFVSGQLIQVKFSSDINPGLNLVEGKIVNIHYQAERMKNVITIAFPAALDKILVHGIESGQELNDDCEIIIGNIRLINKIFPSLLKLENGLMH